MGSEKGLHNLGDETAKVETPNEFVFPPTPITRRRLATSKDK
jgi:hypothetical protein